VFEKSIGAGQRKDKTAIIKIRKSNSISWASKACGDIGRNEAPSPAFETADSSRREKPGSIPAEEAWWC